ncbi:HD domain-containing protein [Paenibacillus senegalensis]|uniref:HD domain-containing protein n=1 Tax=Paenibacillus senegalensis TaxID=1465766 RepID=UPI000288D378|nr:HD domain-containing protein [Paenibacillus senegalensis]
MKDRLQQQIDFIVEIDKLKQISRRSRLIGTDRLENDAEHSWHIATMAILLSEHANEPSLDLIKVLRMLLIHDLVEIDAGDTFAYDTDGHKDKREREERAAKRIFGLLPADQAEEFVALWHEFEERKTVEARYAVAMDRLQPLLLNYFNEGCSWRANQIKSSQVLAYNEQITSGSAKLWTFARGLIRDAVDKGYFANEPVDGKN